MSWTRLWKSSVMLSQIVLHICFYALLKGAEAEPASVVPHPSATVAEGVVIGTTTLLPPAIAPVKKFLTIPFAQPPVRWTPPQPSEIYPSLLEAESFQAKCIQNGQGKHNSAISHDCRR